MDKKYFLIGAGLGAVVVASGIVGFAIGVRYTTPRSFDSAVDTEVKRRLKRQADLIVQERQKKRGIDEEFRNITDNL